MSSFIGKWDAGLFLPKQRLLMHMKLWLWQTMTWMLRKSEQCPEYITLMVCNRTKGQVFPGTQITFSWSLRFENSLSFAKFTFWADTQFNWIAASRFSLMWVPASREKERQSELCWPWHAITPAQLGWYQQGAPKKYHYSVVFVSSNQRVTLKVEFEESTACTRNETRKQIDLVIESQDTFFFPLNTNWQKLSVNWTEQWLMLK